MDKPQSYEPEEAAVAADDDAAIERPPGIGTDERRMHVRAYNFWASLLRDRAYPSIDDLDPGGLGDFDPNSVLLDFSRGVDNPVIAWLGPELREECDVADTIITVSEVPPRSLLSRLTDHYMQIIANQAPIGFEAEFKNARGANTMYRGILMPFSSDDDTIDFIYGVISWKEVAGGDVESQLQAEFARSIEGQKQQALPPSPIWEDGPHEFTDGEFKAEPEQEIEVEAENASGERDPAPADPIPAIEETLATPENLSDYLVVARESAEQAKSADQRSRAALYDALGRAYDFALSAEEAPGDYEDILEEAGITQQDRAPMTPVVKLVFGTDYDKTRLTEFATALGHAKRENIARGTFSDYLSQQKGGLKAVVSAERELRRPEGKADTLEQHYAALRELEAVDFAEFEGSDTGEEFALLIARRLPDGRLAILGEVPHDKTLADRAVRKFTR
jgi:hypothetical protein